MEEELSTACRASADALEILSNLTVRENATFGRSDDVTILLFCQIIARKIWAPRKTLLLGSIVQFLGLSKSHYKPSLSNFACVRVVNVWQRESIKSVSFWNGFEEGAAILTGIECKYMFLSFYFNSLPNFFDIGTNFPGNYNM